jgi:hypothetical protein
MAGRRRHGLRATGLPLADLIASEMEAQNLHLGRLASMLRAAGSCKGEHSRASEALVCRWRSGQITPGENHLRLLSQVLGIDPALMAAAAKAQRHILTSGSHQSSTSGVLSEPLQFYVQTFRMVNSGDSRCHDSVANEFQREMSMNRRAFVRHLALISANGAIDIEFLAAILKGSATPDTQMTDEMEKIAHQYMEQWATSPPHDLLLIVDEYIKGIRLALGNSNSTIISTRLQAMTAELLVYAALLCWYMQRRPAAEEYLRRAEIMVRDAGPRTLRAISLVITSDFHSQVQLGGGSGSMASRALLQAAEEVIGTAPSPARSWVLMRRAEEEAAIGRSTETHHYLDAADASLASAELSQTGMLAHWNQSIHTGFRGNCERLLCNFSDSAQILSHLLIDQPTPVPSNQASIQADLGSVYAQKGEVDQACHLLGQSLSIAIREGFEERVKRIRGIRSLHLGKYQHDPAVQHLDLQLQSTIHASVSH